MTAALAVFLTAIVVWVSHGYYNDRIKPLREVVIVVNDTSFDMDYYVKTLEVYGKGVDPSQFYFMSDMVANRIVRGEVLRQGAATLGIETTSEEISEKIEENDLPNKEVYRDMVATDLLNGRLQEHFASLLPDTMEQANIQVMLVESQAAADVVKASLGSGWDFIELAEEFLCNPEVEVEPGWLPRDLIVNPLIADAVFEPGSDGVRSLYDDSAVKSVGYWLIEVIERDDEEEMIHARAMLLGSEEEAKQVKAQLTGDNFAELAEAHSQHLSSEDGGELDWIEKGNVNSEAFDQVAFSLEPNIVSAPVKDETAQTKGGYWIVNVLEKGDHELSQDVKDRLTMKAFDDWGREQTENSTIEIFLDAAKKSWAVDRAVKGK
ncbi:MAG: peptidylprolyl isomerase [Dehalococcoidia bacterium]|nr:peptidylprolyl isomerase [Dehalococcoidia bacterium]